LILMLLCLYNPLCQSIFKQLSNINDFFLSHDCVYGVFNIYTTLAHHLPWIPIIPPSSSPHIAHTQLF
jgi:hypothetical protein